MTNYNYYNYEIYTIYFDNSVVMHVSLCYYLPISKTIYFSEKQGPVQSVVARPVRGKSTIGMKMFTVNCVLLLP